MELILRLLHLAPTNCRKIKQFIICFPYILYTRSGRNLLNNLIFDALLPIDESKKKKLYLSSLKSFLASIIIYTKLKTFQYFQFSSILIMKISPKSTAMAMV